jgi:rubrerythrin
VGGDHYHSQGNQLQHWDVVRIFKLDYFQGQITKYVLRWKDKHSTHEGRVQDLKKARHFLDKYIETAEDWDFRLAEELISKEPMVVRTEVHTWCAVEGYFGNMTQEYKCLHCHVCTVAAAPPEACPACGNGQDGLTRPK